MKTILTLFALGTSSLLLVPARAADPVASPAAGAGAMTHTLFMGTDIDVQQNKAFYRVENVAGGSFVIKVDGQEKSIPMKFSSVNLKLSPQLKLTETSVEVAKLTVERSYTPNNDPNKKFMAAQMAGAAQTMVGQSAHTAALAQQTLAAESRNVGPPAFPNPVDYAAQAATAQREFNSAVGTMDSDQSSSGYSAGKLADELAEEMFDAIEITFEISAEKSLNSPYAVIVAQFREKDAKPNEVKNWIFATELEPITGTVRRVRIKEGGFPRGFELKNYQLHLYNRGQELASTVAPKRVALTRDEAFDYVMLDYLSSHKGRSVPASLAMGRLATGLRNSLQTPALFVKVSKDGLSLGTYSDEACSQKIDDPALENALRDLRFKPALDKGKPVDGVAKL